VGVGAVEGEQAELGDCGHDPEGSQTDDSSIR
jgi:hypothetical protein